MLGYSGSGTAVGELIYVNYGRIEDFELLDRIGISVEGTQLRFCSGQGTYVSAIGCIAIVRYGQNFRGIKAMLAQERCVIAARVQTVICHSGAAGVLIYSDPADDGYVRGAVYPDGPWRPPQVRTI